MNKSEFAQEIREIYKVPRKLNKCRSARLEQQWRCASPTDSRMRSPKSILHNRFKKLPMSNDFLDEMMTYEEKELVQ